MDLDPSPEHRAGFSAHAPVAEAGLPAGAEPSYTTVPRKPIEIPPASARALIADIRAFHRAKTGFEKDEIAARQLHALRKHSPSWSKKLRIADIWELFNRMSEHGRSRS